VLEEKNETIYFADNKGKINLIMAVEKNKLNNI